MICILYGLRINISQFEACGCLFITPQHCSFKKYLLITYSVSLWSINHSTRKKTGFIWIYYFFKVINTVLDAPNRFFFFFKMLKSRGRGRGKERNLTQGLILGSQDHDLRRKQTQLTEPSGHPRYSLFTDAKSKLPLSISRSPL